MVELAQLELAAEGIEDLPTSNEKRLTVKKSGTENIEKKPYRPND